MKVTIVGAGNVGATCADVILIENNSEVVLFDIKEGFAEGKARYYAMCTNTGFNTKVSGVTNDYILKQQNGSDYISSIQEKE
jgi:malate dehydrogenase